MTEEQELKRFYGAEVATQLGEHIAAVHPAFDVENYAAAVAQGVVGLELKARIALMREELRARLPADYREALAILVASLSEELPTEEGAFTTGGYWSPALSFVQHYGLAEPEASLAALNAMTRRNTAEEAIRPYIEQHYDLTMAHLREWATDESLHVRRLVSEGTRPRLPWASRLDRFIQDPRPALALLETLRDDPSVYVQRSVANHLNDISKDHPDLVIEVAARWLAEKPYFSRSHGIVQHGLRTLIKNRNAQALALLGAEPPTRIEVMNFRLTPDHINLGDSVTLMLDVMNRSDAPQMLVIDYAIHFVKAQGKTREKVFKWGTRTYGAGEGGTLRKQHSFRPISTRRYYSGTHRISVQINGVVMATAEVELGEG